MKRTTGIKGVDPKSKNGIKGVDPKSKNGTSISKMGSGRPKGARTALTVAKEELQVNLYLVNKWAVAMISRWGSMENAITAYGLGQMQPLEAELFMWMLNRRVTTGVDPMIVEIEKIRAAAMAEAATEQAKAVNVQINTIMAPDESMRQPATIAEHVKLALPGSPLPPPSDAIDVEAVVVEVGGKKSEIDPDAL